jgi:hypothetical protein
LPDSVSRAETIFHKREANELLMAIELLGLFRSQLSNDETRDLYSGGPLFRYSPD